MYEKPSLIQTQKMFEYQKKAQTKDIFSGGFFGGFWVSILIKKNYDYI